MNLNSIRCSQQQKDEYENTEGLPTDGSESTEGLPTDGSESTEGLLREDLGRLVASRWTGEKTEHQVEEVEEFFFNVF
jgi:protein kinase C substrate 80K-H